VGGLRVWLERPWYPSGEDEMLGVVLSGADGIVAAEDLRRHYVSLWGKDPIRVNGELASAVPRPRDFAGTGLLQMDRLTLDETDSKHPGVTVVGHPLKYSPARDKWYADLEIDPGEAYWPFLRLGLTRFQPWSVTDAHLSKVVVVDFVHLTNRRTAAVTRPDPAIARVTVSGIEEWRYAPEMLPPPQAKAQETRALPASAPEFAAAAFRGAGITASTAGIFSPPPTRGVRAWVEQHGTTASDLDWQRVGDVIDLPRIDEDEVMRVWSGDVPLQVPLAAQRPGTDPGGAGSDWRLVTTEWESLPFDTAGGDGAMIERICYLDRFPL
jgi:hypothetical protein